MFSLAWRKMQWHISGHRNPKTTKNRTCWGCFAARSWGNHQSSESEAMHYMDRLDEYQRNFLIWFRTNNFDTHSDGSGVYWSVLFISCDFWGFGHSVKCQSIPSRYYFQLLVKLPVHSRFHSRTIPQLLRGCLLKYWHALFDEASSWCSLHNAGLPSCHLKHGV